MLPTKNIVNSFDVNQNHNLGLESYSLDGKGTFTSLRSCLSQENFPQIDIARCNTDFNWPYLALSVFHDCLNEQFPKHALFSPSFSFLTMLHLRVFL